MNQSITVGSFDYEVVSKTENIFTLRGERGAIYRLVRNVASPAWSLISGAGRTLGWFVNDGNEFVQTK